MRWRGSWRLVAVAALVVAGAVPVAVYAGSSTLVGDNARTLTLALPGPFNGCTYLDAGTTPTMNAVNDLVVPSAFQTTPADGLVGAGGPIASAELTSLSPETVVYTIAPHQRWSNGQPFTVRDLVAWWQRARTLASVVSDGYRDISSMKVAANDRSVTATFGDPYADWNVLFRDVQWRGAPMGCALGDLLRRPSLGPYDVVSATRSRIVLVMNPHWPTDTTRFGRLVLLAGNNVPSGPTVAFASYSLRVNRAAFDTLSAHPWLLSHLGSSSSIEELAFAPLRPLTRRTALRKALAWALNRQDLINQLWGAVTFLPTVANSALFSQGQIGYPGGSGSPPTVPDAPSSTTTTVTATPTLGDCPACAVAVFEAAGYHRSRQGWRNEHGALLTIRVAVAPGSINRATARILVRQWRDAGVAVHEVGASSNETASRLAATNRVDVALFTRPTGTSPAYSARSWSGAPYPDAFATGFSSTVTNSLFQSALATFNPVTALSTWHVFDHAVMGSFWVRPLFTAPSLIEWTGSMAGVEGALSVPGFVDQIPGWTTATPGSSGN